MFTEVARRFGHIDLALLPIGPIAPAEMMRAHHLDPAQALVAMDDLGAEQLVPIHFGTWLHSYDAPGDCERAFDAAVVARAALPGHAGLAARVHRLDQGERFVVLPTGPTAPAGPTEPAGTTSKPSAAP